MILFLAHRGALVNYANGIVRNQAEAEDLVQEAWIRFGLAMHGRPLDEPVGYLYRVVRNLAVDGQRRTARSDRIFESAEETAPEIPEDRPSSETEVADIHALRRLREALDELPERTRIALEMQRFGGFKLREIAAHFGISITAAHEIIAEGIAHCRRRVHSSDQ